MTLARSISDACELGQSVNGPVRSTGHLIDRTQVRVYRTTDSGVKK